MQKRKRTGRMRGQTLFNKSEYLYKYKLAHNTFDLHLVKISCDFYNYYR